MKKAFIFPGQGSQFQGMGAKLVQDIPVAEALLEKANDVLGFDITSVMKTGDNEALRQTHITQNAIFIYSYAHLAQLNEKVDMVAGHSLGEITALCATGVLPFEQGLRLVNVRASAMQKACEDVPSTMVAVLGLEEHTVEEICCQIKEEVIVPANYNCPGQIVISGNIKGIEIASSKLKKAGAKRVLPLPVGGAFHSPLMKPAQDEFQNAVIDTVFQKPRCPIYQNVSATPITNVDALKKNIIEQLTHAVKWTQSVQAMVSDGCTNFVEIGPGKVLQGLVRKIDKSVTVSSVEG